MSPSPAPKLSGVLSPAPGQLFRPEISRPSPGLLMHSGTASPFRSGKESGLRSLFRSAALTPIPVTGSQADKRSGVMSFKLSRGTPIYKDES